MVSKESEIFMNPILIFLISKVQSFKVALIGPASLQGMLFLCVRACLRACVVGGGCRAR